MALRQAFSALTEACVRDVGNSLRITRLILDTPPLLARGLERQSLWRSEIAIVLAKRSGLNPKKDYRSELAAAVALAAFLTTVLRWLKNDRKTSMDKMLDEAFEVIRPAPNLTSIKQHYGHVNTVKHADRVLQGMAGWELPHAESYDAHARASKAAEAHDKSKRGQRNKPRWPSTSCSRLWPEPLAEAGEGTLSSQRPARTLFAETGL